MDKKVLLFSRVRLPVIRLQDRYREPLVVGRRIRRDALEVIEIPRLSDRERAVGVFAALMHTNPAGLTHCDHDDSGLAVSQRRAGRRRFGR